MARKPRIVIPGYPHHIVHKGNSGQGVFLDRQDFLRYLKLLEHYSEIFAVKILAYCLMLNHVHILAVPADIGSLAQMMHSIAGLYARFFNVKHEKKGHVWESRYYSSVVESDAYRWAVALYIEWNPVRANLALKPEEYEFSSAAHHALGDGDPVISEPLFDESDMQEYRRLLAEGPREADIATIRTCTNTSKPIGTKGFLAHLAEEFGFRPSRRRGRPLGN